MLPDPYARKPPQTETRIPLGQLRRVVLCVDDDAAVLRMETLLLEESGKRVLASNDAKSALALFSGQWIDLAVIDYSMPELNGAELARAMRRLKPEVPILMLSGQLEPPAGVSDEIDAYVSKGQQTSVLLNKIEELLNGTKNMAKRA